MRYAQKMVCLLVLVLAASFGIGGCVLLYSDFAVQRSRAPGCRPAFIKVGEQCPSAVACRGEHANPLQAMLSIERSTQGRSAGRDVPSPLQWTG